MSSSSESVISRLCTLGFNANRIHAGIILLSPIILLALFPELFAPYDPFESVDKPFTSPKLSHPFGTDDLGRDLLSGVIAGARTSLIAGISVTIISVTIGCAVGLFAGFIGGHLDDILMRFTEIMQALPRFFIAILIIAFFGGSLLNLILVLGLTSWAGLARLARAEALSLRRQEFVLAAMAMGGSNLWLLRTHIIPNAYKPLLVSAIFVFTGAILTEAGLGYLGLSDPNFISWGQLIFNAQNFLYHAWWMSILPGISFVTVVFGVALIADGLDKN